jgi:hypothetical protein
MNRRLLFLLVLFSVSAQAQNWTPFLDSSRAIDWSSAGFTIPNYTANCATQPTLQTGSSNAGANKTAIQNALNSCDSSHNVVNIPAGTYYVTSITFGNQGHQVLRGAGPNSTTLVPTTGVGCSGGQSTGICMIDQNDTYAGNPNNLPPNGSNQCSWTAGYAQGTTSITLNNCGHAPPANEIVVLDQANDTSDNNGIYICDTNTSNCGVESTSGGNNDGRFISGVTHSQQQVTQITGVTSLGGGSYSVTISPGVYFSNIRSSQAPGAWWFDTVQNDGLENLTIDGSTMGSSHPSDFGNIGMYQCYQCWVKNVRSQSAGRYHLESYQSFQDVIRDSYFYGALGGGSQSYGIEMEVTSGVLIENNIFQQTTAPIMFGAGTGNVVDYNLSLDDYYTSSPTYTQSAYYAHNAGNEMNLFEGNNFVVGPWGDDSWGSSTQTTIFRSMSPGWYTGKSESTLPFIARSRVRAINLVGNVLGQPGYHNLYQAYATSTSGGVNGANEAKSVYSLGWVTQDGACSGGVLNNSCDPLVVSTLMRWGNYDVVNAAPQWNSSEASPAAVPHVNANFSSSYFSSLAHTLPNSLYYRSQPSWWPSGVAWPPIGPDVTGGNIGACSGGTYAGAQAVSPSQCTGGSLKTAWGSYVNAIPAQACYLNTMNGPPDGSGSPLSFDASQCYGSGSGSGTPPAPPKGLTATVN